MISQAFGDLRRGQVVPEDHDPGRPHPAVKENAAAFGGDGERINVLGISAGAKLLGALMTRPEAGRLFSRVILESGARQAFRDIPTAARVTERFLRSAGISDPRELLTMSTGEILRAQARFCDCHGSTAFFGPVLDGRSFDARRGEDNGWKGEALIGSGRNEMIRLARSEAFREDPDGILRELFGDRAGEVRQTVEEAGADWTKGLSDAMYRHASDLLAERLVKSGSRVWSYSFDFLPAHHGMGFHFLMKQWEAPYCAVPEEKRTAARVVSECMNAAARAFIAQGDPDPKGELGWRELTKSGEGEKQVFDEAMGKCPFAGDTLHFPGKYTYVLR